MSDEMKWNQEPSDGGADGVHENTDSEAVTPNVPDTEKTGAEAAGYREMGSTGAEQSTQPESDSRSQKKEPVPPRYGYYQVQQDQNRTAPGNVQSPRPRRGKRKKSFAKRLGSTVVLAVVFGLVAGAVFQGVNAVSRMVVKEETEPLGTTEILGEITKEDKESPKEISSSAYTVADVARASMPSVVAITSVSIQEIPEFFGYGTRQYQTAGSGSGIIVGENDKELLIATNNHVVEGATTLSVCFIGNDVVNAEEETQSLASGNGDINVEDAVAAKVKGTDPENDLAVVAVSKNDIPADTMSEIKIAKLGSSDSLVMGEQVVAIGNALGYGQSVTSGWVSALDRKVTWQDGSVSELIQTDAAINPGNSGGALLNMRGEVIGINVAKYADSAVEGIGYAIPISKAQPILENLSRDKVDQSKAAYLGVELAEDVSADIIQMYNMPVGAFVIRVIEGEAAEAAGIKKGDIIRKLDGQMVSGGKDLINKLQYYEAGTKAEFVIARADNGEYQEHTINVTLGIRPQKGE